MFALSPLLTSLQAQGIDAIQDAQGDTLRPFLDASPDAVAMDAITLNAEQYRALIDAAHYVLSIDTATRNAQIRQYETTLRACDAQYTALSAQYSALERSFKEYDAIHQSHTERLTASLKRAHSDNNALVKIAQLQSYKSAGLNDALKVARKHNRQLKRYALPAAAIGGLLVGLLVK